MFVCVCVTYFLASHPISSDIMSKQSTLFMLLLIVAVAQETTKCVTVAQDLRK